MRHLRHRLGHWLLRDETHRGVVSFETESAGKWSTPVAYDLQCRGADIERALLKVRRQRGARDLGRS